MTERSKKPVAMHSTEMPESAQNTPDAVPLSAFVSRVISTLTAEAQAFIRERWRVFVNRLETISPEQLCEQIPHEVAEHLPRLVACSDFLLMLVARFPMVFVRLAQEGRLHNAELAWNWPLALKQFLGEDWLLLPSDTFDQKLRQFRNQAYLSVIWRDLVGVDELWTTTETLSTLADAVITVTCDYHHHHLSARYGEPLSRAGAAQQLVVLAMGKLGAHELNLSSDVDLIFVYPEVGETAQVRDANHPETTGKEIRSLTNQEFFIRLGQRVIQSLSKVTQDGFVFRVDMRLRPFGQSGELALNFDAFEAYYQEHGRCWERYALIKARPITGDPDAGLRLMERLRPFVYRRYLDYAVIEELRQIKALINREVLRHGGERNLKTGSGGIREIEFIAQAFQLVRGGQQLMLQQRSLRAVLEVLEHLKLFPQKAVAELHHAYVFLRRSEHGLQAIADRQTHALPDDATEQLRLALMMRFADWTSYFDQLEVHRGQVRAHFNGMIALPTVEGRVDDAMRLARFQVWWLGELPDNQVSPMLIHIRDEERGIALEAVAEFRRNVEQKRPSRESRDRLDRLMPLLLSQCVEQKDTASVLLRLLPILLQILKRSAYLLFLIEYPAALDRLIRLCALSSWLAEYLMKFPILLDALLDDPDNLLSFDVAVLEDSLRQQLMRVPEHDLENQMEILRQFKNEYVFHVVVSEVENHMSIRKVSNCLTGMAQVVLGAALHIAARQISERLGLSQETLSGLLDEHYLIVALGKMGGYEMGYGSDLDLIFLHDVNTAEPISSVNTLEKGVFFTRVTQRLIHILSTRTHSGRLYEIDTRLRPAGGSGLLVNSLDYMERYLLQDAWTWEHQALVRSRPIFGSDRLRERFASIRRKVLCQSRSRAELRHAVVDMREKMLENLSSGENSSVFHIKQDPGGIVDIEFMAQFGTLLWAHQYPELIEHTDTVHLLKKLVIIGQLSAEDAALLSQAYLNFRSAIHRLVLQNRKIVLDSGEFAEQRSHVRRIWEAFVMRKW